MTARAEMAVELGEGDLARQLAWHWPIRIRDGRPGLFGVPGSLLGPADLGAAIYDGQAPNQVEVEAMRSPRTIVATLLA